MLGAEKQEVLKDDLAKTRAGAWLTIDLKALMANYRLFDEKTGTSCDVAAIVKANAYGLGVKPVADTLYSCGARSFFVATLEEALELKAHLDEQNSKITRLAILGGLFHGCEQDYSAHNLSPVLNSLDEIERWQKQAAKTQHPLPAIIHFDTGMNRLGLGPRETQTLLDDPDKLDGLDVQMIMSHFACADEKDHPMTEAQFEQFDQLAKAFPETVKSLANSSGIFRTSKHHYELVRPGMAMYGLNPTPEKINPMTPVISLETRILQTRNARRDSTIGYSATYRFKKDTAVATVALGYADGFLRALSNKGTLYYKGQPCPIIGRVSMDLVTVDISGLEQKPEPGEIMEVIGLHQTADDLASAAGTIGYEILTDLGRRYHRTYKQ